MSAVRASLDKSSYRPGETMTLTVEVDPPADSTITFPVAVAVGQRHREWVETLPAWREFVTDTGTAWRREAIDGTRITYLGEARSDGRAVARLDWLGGSETAAVSYTVAAPASPLLLGLTYPTGTGESQPQATTRLFAEFPQAAMYRVFRGVGQALPAWDSALMQAIPPHVHVVMSSKDWRPDEWPAWFAGMPAERRAAGTLIWFLYQHEFDQWKSPSDTRGRPDPALWRTRMHQLVASGEGQPWRQWVRFGACYMEYGLRTRPDWHALWGLNVPDSALAVVDFHAPDCYNLGPTRYRPSGEMFQQPLELAARYGKPVLAAEWGHARREDTPDPAGQVCAQVMRSHIDYLRTQTTAPVVGACWYYNHDNTLSEPGRVLRPAEYDTLQHLIAAQGVAS